MAIDLGKKVNVEDLGFIEDLASDTLEGFEQIRTETMAIPFVRVLQKLSPQLDSDSPAYIEGAKVGQWFNTLTKEVYGDTINCIVLKFERIYIEWKPNRGGFVSYHSVENAEQLVVDRTFGHWKTVDGNDLQENYVYMILIEGHEKEGLCVLSLSSSGIKAAKEWNRLMLTNIMPNGQRAKPYYMLWTVKSILQKNDQGTWYAPTMHFHSYINQEQYALAKTERLALPSRQVDYAQLSAKIEDDTAF